MIRRSVISIFEARKIAVLGFEPEKLRLARFVLRSRRWSMERPELFDLDPEQPGDGWQRALAAAGRDSQLILLTGEVPGGIFFQCRSVELSPAEQRDALALELPRRLLRVPKLPVMQFLAAPPDAEGAVRVNTYLFGNDGLEFLVSRLSLAGGGVDHFCYPLLALEPDDPPVRLAGAEAGFFFEAGAWRRISDDAVTTAAAARWRERLGVLFDFPPEFPGAFEEWIPLMLAASLAVRGELARHRAELRVLPREVRPVRYRAQLILAAILGGALLLVGGWNWGRGFFSNFSANRKMSNELRELRNRSSAIQRELKRTARERKEMAKILAQPQGEHDVLSTFALISKILPRTVMVSSLRWSDTGIDLVMQSEEGNLDVQSILRPLTAWKIGQLQQRQFGDSAVTTVTVKLVPAESASSAKKTAGSGKRQGRRK